MRYWNFARRASTATLYGCVMLRENARMIALVFFAYLCVSLPLAVLQGVSELREINRKLNEAATDIEKSRHEASGFYRHVESIAGE